LIVNILIPATVKREGTKLKEMAYAGHTTYTADNYQNNTKPKHRNSIGVNRSKKAQNTHKNMTQKFIKVKMEYRLGTFILQGTLYLIFHTNQWCEYISFVSK